MIRSAPVGHDHDSSTRAAESGELLENSRKGRDEIGHHPDIRVSERLSATKVRELVGNLGEEERSLLQSTISLV